MHDRVFRVSASSCLRVTQSVKNGSCHPFSICHTSFFLRDNLVFFFSCEAQWSGAKFERNPVLVTPLIFNWKLNQAQHDRICHDNAPRCCLENSTPPSWWWIDGFPSRRRVLRKTFHQWFINKMKSHPNLLLASACVLGKMEIMGESLWFIMKNSFWILILTSSNMRSFDRPCWIWLFSWNCKLPYHSILSNQKKLKLAIVNSSSKYQFHTEILKCLQSENYGFMFHVRLIAASYWCLSKRRDYWI